MPAAVPTTVLPVSAVLPATVRPWFATTAALAVMGPELAAKVVAALTVSVCQPAEDPMTVFPLSARNECAVMAA